MPLCVLGGMAQKAVDGRWQLAAPDRAVLLEIRIVGGAHLSHRAIDSLTKRRDELLGSVWPRAADAFGLQYLELLHGQHFATRVREQPVDAADCMTNMESDRRRVA